MSNTENKVYILIALDDVSDKINSYIDAGYFSEAKDLDHNIWALKDKIKSLISEKGGDYLISTYERHVLLLPLSIAENLPLILEFYKNVFGSKMQVGIGLNMAEAKKAAELSAYTGKIEMYDPEQKDYQDMQKNQEFDISDDLFELNPQPNLYDRQHPQSPEPAANKIKIGQAVQAPNAQTAFQMETQLINATVQQLNASAQQVQQQAQQQMQQQAQQQQSEQPKELMDALGGQKPKQKTKKEPQGSEEPKEEKVGQNAVEQSKKDAEQKEEDSKESEKLANLLEMVNEKIPKLTDLADKNPEAFKKVIGLVHKIVDMAKGKKKDLDKTEIKDVTEELNKAIKLFYPVGTTKKGRKKVMINGKAVWRSVRAGQLKDNEGNAISVQSHNIDANKGTAGVKE